MDLVTCAMGRLPSKLLELLKEESLLQKKLYHDLFKTPSEAVGLVARLG
jgi:hypothetical protein